MKNLLIILMLVTFSFSFISAQRTVYKSSADITTREVIVPEKYINKEFSLKENGIAYEKGYYEISSEKEIIIKGWKQQKVLNKKLLVFVSEKGNLIKELQIPLNKEKTAWFIIILVFLYYFIFMKWIFYLKYYYDVPSIFAFAAITFAAIAIVIVYLFFLIPFFIFSIFNVAILFLVAFIAIFNDFNEYEYIKYIYTILSLIGMGIVSYAFNTPIFIVCTSVGIILAWLLQLFTKKL